MFEEKLVFSPVEEIMYKKVHNEGLEQFKKYLEEVRFLSTAFNDVRVQLCSILRICWS